jgi:hypothetical protein
MSQNLNPTSANEEVLCSYEISDRIFSLEVPNWSIYKIVIYSDPKENIELDLLCEGVKILSKSFSGQSAYVLFFIGCPLFEFSLNFALSMPKKIDLVEPKVHLRDYELEIFNVLNSKNDLDFSRSLASSSPNVSTYMLESSFAGRMKLVIHTESKKVSLFCGDREIDFIDSSEIGPKVLFVTLLENQDYYLRAASKIDRVDVLAHFRNSEFI